GDAHFLEHGSDRLELLLGVRAARIDDVQEQAGLPGFFERRLERSDQMMRQIADEADRVTEQDAAPVRDLPGPGAGVERREELVAGHHFAAGELVEQRALAGVGVADERDGVLLESAADLTLLAGLDGRQALLEVADP